MLISDITIYYEYAAEQEQQSRNPLLSLFNAKNPLFLRPLHFLLAEKCARIRQT